MPERRCSACRENRPAEQMIRLVATPAVNCSPIYGVEYLVERPMPALNEAA